MRDHLEEYLDGLLDEEQRREVERALASDPALRAELERARRFAELLDGLGAAGAVRRTVARVRRRRRGRILRLASGLAAAAAAVLLVWIALRPATSMRSTHEDSTLQAVEREWVEFGRRLGRIAAERRTGRVPRTGLGDFEVPPVRGYGIVFRGALEALGVDLDRATRERAQDMVRDHFVAMRGLGDDAAGECKRAEAALELYRRLRSEAGRAAADAYYDVFRPALATPRNVRRVSPGTLAEVIRADAARYLKSYDETIRRLGRRYGKQAVSVAVRLIAGEDRRFLRRDPSQEGLGRDAVLAIRAMLYRAACDAGADRLYVIG